MNIKKYFRKGYYIYLFRKAKKTEPRQYIFLDFTTLVVFLVAIALNVLFFFHGKVSWHFPDLQNQIYICEMLLRTTSIFIGILFSILVLAFNIFYRYFGRFAFIDFFKRRGIKFLFTAFLSTIAFITYALSYMHELKEANTYSTSLLVLSVAFSTISVFSVFPALILMLRKMQNRANIKTVVQVMNQNNEKEINDLVEELEWNEAFAFDGIKYDNNPVALLTEIGTVAIKEHDITTADTIIAECLILIKKTQKVFAQNATEVHAKQVGFVYGQISTLFKNLFFIAAKERSETIMLNIVRVRFWIEKVVISDVDKIALKDFDNSYYGWDLQFDAIDFFNRSVQFNEDEVSRRIIDEWRDYIEKIIIDYLPARKFDYDPKDRMKFKNDEGIVTGLFAKVTEFFDVSLQAKKFGLFKNFSNLYGTTYGHISSSKNTSSSKALLFNVNSNYALDCFEKYVKSPDVREVSFLYYPFGAISVGLIPSKGESLTPFIASLKAIDVLFANDKLNTMVINQLKADNMGFINEIEKQSMCQKAIELSMKKFDQLRGFIQDGASDKRKEIYILLQKNLGYILDDAISNGMKKNQATLQLIDETYKRFTLTTKFKEELDAKGYLYDERIV